MKKIITLLFTSVFGMINALFAQPMLFYTPVNEVNINVRPDIVVVGQIDADLPSDGKVIVHFDGYCFITPGDRLVLAASNTEDWGVNDGNIGLETTSDLLPKSFSHSRSYDVTAGANSFYAVAQNYVETEGNGIVTIHGALTVEFFPAGEDAALESTGIIFDGDLSSMTTVGEVTVHASGPGQVFVRFDGSCSNDPGDRIVLAASNDGNWYPNDGAVGVEVPDNDVNYNSFSHTRMYEVASAGDYTYYAVAHNYVETDGSGYAYIYGNLEAEFFPDAGNEIAAFSPVDTTDVNLNIDPVILTSIDLDFASNGTALVQFDGSLTSLVGDYITLAATNTGIWAADDGNVTLGAYDADVNRNTFSHSRVYETTAGANSFQAVGEKYILGVGLGIASVYGELNVKFFPSESTVIMDDDISEESISVLPNPVSQFVTITMRDFNSEYTSAVITNLFGAEVMAVELEATSCRLDISDLAPGLYFVHVGNEISQFVKI